MNPESLFLDYYPRRVGAMASSEPEKEEPKEEAAAKASTSPLDKTGPMPPELLKDPYSVELFPVSAVAAPVTTSKKFLNQERLIWLSAVGVSWAVTIVALLRAMRII